MLALALEYIDASSNLQMPCKSTRMWLAYCLQSLLLFIKDLTHIHDRGRKAHEILYYILGMLDTVPKAKQAA
jgi:hypothetical protein